MANQAGLPQEVPIASPLLREHLRELMESSAFKGSRRCQQFLQYVVDKALAGQLEDLKERSLGVALFGRSPSYDTGDDAIVRVTASDVRKRLQQYYSGTESAIRFELPAGSYLPEFRAMAVREIPTPTAPAPLRQGRRDLRIWVGAMMLLGILALCGTWIYRENLAREAREKQSPLNVLPWSALFRGGRPVQLILADPDVPAMEALTRARISLSDYANRRYIQNPNLYGPDMQRAFTLLRGVNVAAVDVGIALDISRLAAQESFQLRTHTARSLQLSSFKSEDHFILLGSPQSNPWSELFASH
ncbi:MAG: hypothetical protein FJW36_17695 [Acidobacteria bacterium]|nr:hypothetical protein [Acidobacteriota bacterium]